MFNSNPNLLNTYGESNCWSGGVLNATSTALCTLAMALRGIAHDASSRGLASKDEMTRRRYGSFTCVSRVIRQGEGLGFLVGEATGGDELWVPRYRRCITTAAHCSVMTIRG